MQTKIVRTLPSIATGLLIALLPPAYGQLNQSAPVPGVAPAAGQISNSAYQQLPLSVGDAQTRIDDLKLKVKDSRWASAQDSVNHLGEWLADMADAHQRLANAFAKQESTKAQFENERQAAQKFAHLKNQVMLLKAELLLRQTRYPEALGPLVDIVVAERHTAIGQEAYKHLQEMGFSETLEPRAVSTPAVSVVKPAMPLVPAAAPVVSKPQAKLIPATPAKIQIAAKPKAAGPVKLASKTTGKKSSRVIKGSPFGHW